MINMYGVYEIGQDTMDPYMCMVIEFAKYGDLENFQKLNPKEKI